MFHILLVDDSDQTIKNCHMFHRSRGALAQKNSNSVLDMVFGSRIESFFGSEKRKKGQINLKKKAPLRSLDTTTDVL